MTAVKARHALRPPGGPDPIDRLPARLRSGWPATLIAALMLALVAAVVVTRLATNQAGPGESVGAVGDFRDATYYPVQALLDGVNPYDPSAYLAYDDDIGQWFPVYGPLHLLIHVPLAALSFDAAVWVYAGLTLALTVLLARTALGLAGFARPAPVVLVTSALLLASNAGRANLVNLQPTIIIVLGIYLALAARRQPWLAAVGVAVAFMKPQFGIPLTALLFATGGAAVAWRGLMVTAATSAPVVLRLIAIEGGIGGVIDSVRDNLEFAAGESISNYQISLTSSFDVGATAAAFVVAALLIAVVGVVLRGRPPPSTAAGLTLLFVAVLLGLFHVTYDALLLAWPALLAVGTAITRGWRLDWILLALLALVFFNPLTASFVIDSVPFKDVLGALSALTLLAAFVVAARLQRRHADDTG